MNNNDYESGFEKIQSAAREAFQNIENDNSKVTQKICDNAKKAADYQEEYDSLMNQKRFRTLSTYENKRARILKSNIDYYKTLREEEFNDIKAKLELGEISNEEYYSQLTSLRDAYFQKGSDEWNKYTLEIIKYNKDVVSEQQKEIEEMLTGIEDKYSQSYENILNKQSSMQKKLDNSFSIYETVYFDMGKGKESEWLRLSNIDEDLRIIKNYNNSLLGAKKRVNAIFEEMGMDDEKTANMQAKFFEQLTKLSIGEGTAFANHISFQPEEDLASFVTKWVEKVDLTEAISKNLYADESQRLMENYATDMSLSFINTLSENFGNIPDTFFQNGQASALEFKNGFLSAVDEAIDGINVELNNKISALMPDMSVLSQGNSVTNNSSYNIYGATSPAETALEIYKQDEKKKMLIGE